MVNPKPGRGGDGKLIGSGLQQDGEDFLQGRRTMPVVRGTLVVAGCPRNDDGFKFNAGSST